MGIFDKILEFIFDAGKDAYNNAKKEKHKMDQEADRYNSQSDDELLRTLKNDNRSRYQRLAAKKVLSERHGGDNAEKIDKDSQTLKLNENNKSKTSPAFRQGDRKDIKTTIILSAPGQAEEKAGRPAAKQTGKTLQNSLEELNKKDPQHFPSKNLDDYTIINSVETIEYKNKTGRTEASDNEIKKTTNIKRIKNVLSDADTVVVLGDKAKIAVKESGFSGVVFEGDHPSMQSLNKKYNSEKESPESRSEDRNKQWANDILKSKKKR